jgi:predicted transcriptional regulator
MSKPINPAISEAESRVMQVLWQRAPQGAEEIADALHRETGWHENTVRTLLNRLVRKGAAEARRDGRRYLYSPRLTREAWQGSESRNLIERVFGGRLAPLLVHFSQHEKLSSRDVAELRRLVEQLERKGKGHA